MAELLAACQSMEKRFGDKVALTQLSFSIERGQLVALLGPNGAGKTTAIRLLCGLLTPDKGSASILGHTLERATEGELAQIRSRCGVMAEVPGFYERLTGEENLQFFGALQGVPRGDRRVIHRLEQVGLLEHRGTRVGAYSKGMKQRLNLARTLLHEPDLLLLDEPSSGLDPRGSQTVHALIQEARNGGAGVLLCTHRLEEAQALADTVLVLRQRPLFFGPMESLLPALDRVRIVFARPLPPDRWPAGVDIEVEDPSHLQLVFRVAPEGVPALVRALVERSAEVLEVVPIRPSLMSRYLALVEP